jgi:hypothetical protein
VVKMPRGRIPRGAVPRGPTWAWPREASVASLGRNKHPNLEPQLEAGNEEGTKRRDWGRRGRKVAPMVSIVRRIREDEKVLPRLNRLLALWAVTPSRFDGCPGCGRPHIDHGLWVD